MEKKKQIERGLGQFCSVVPGIEVLFPNIDLDALADQAIVIECEVEHRDGDTSLFINESEDNIWLEGHHGTPGKAIAIIVPLQEDD